MVDMIEMRDKIDELDKQLLDVLEKRFEVTNEVGKFKAENKLPVEDKDREQKIIEKRSSQTSLSQEFVEKLYGMIFAESKKLQQELVK